MGMAKRVAYAIILALFLFIAMAFAEIAGVSPFDSGFISTGGLITILIFASLEMMLNTL